MVLVGILLRYAIGESMATPARGWYTWQAMGETHYPRSAQLAELKVASGMHAETFAAVAVDGLFGSGNLHFKLLVPACDTEFVRTHHEYYERNTDPTFDRII